ncbi:MAG TPA: FAD-dependent oxidoreductase [Blastocatellia bacterium]|nr:FAD-dependent oxidoreductase [Blastocatellia bacterium]
MTGGTEKFMADYDVIVLGGGPAGISSLLWCNSLGLRAMLLEQAPELGGQLLQMFHRVIDYPGVVPENGRELRDRFQTQLNELQLRYRLGCQLRAISLNERTLVCDDEPLTSKAIIIATGASKRRLGIPGEDRFAIRGGVSFSATRDHGLYAGKKVCVIGGGDSAVENSLILSRVCPQVILIHRSDDFRARAEWLSEARQTSNITFLTGFNVKAIEGGDSVERLIVEDVGSGKLTAIETEGVFVRVGIAPNTDVFRGQIELNDAGYVLADQRQQTSTEWIYAAGDVCNPVCLSVATAVGQGAIAAKSIARKFGEHDK